MMFIKKLFKLKRFIYLTGPDGIGKTSHLNEIELNFKSKKCFKIWIRSPKIFSKPLMLFCRICGLTIYENIKGVTYGYHLFYKSKLISFIYPFLQLIDFYITWSFYRLKMKKYDIILLDRFSLDTLADLMVDTRKMNLHKTWVGKQFINFIPENSLTIVLDVDENIIRERKVDTLHDRNLSLKINVFDILSKDLDIVKINNNKDFQLVSNLLMNKILDD